MQADVWEEFTANKGYYKLKTHVTGYSGHPKWTDFQCFSSDIKV